MELRGKPEEKELQEEKSVKSLTFTFYVSLTKKQRTKKIFHFLLLC